MTVGARVRISCGSVNSWNVPMTEKITVSSRAGRMDGILIDHAMLNSEAPSTRAASYSSAGSERSAA
jgi:hypothetical protein